MTNEESRDSDLNRWLIVIVPSVCVLSLLLRTHVLEVLALLLGFSCLECGCSRGRRFADVLAGYAGGSAAGGIGYFVLGFYFMYGGSPVMEYLGLSLTPAPFEESTDIGYSVWADLRFQTRLVVFSCAVLISSLTAAATIGQRIGACVTLSVIAYPLFGRVTWGAGWLGSQGYSDFSGANIIYALGAWCALGAWIVLPRNKSSTSDLGRIRRPWMYAIGAGLLCFVLFLKSFVLMLWADSFQTNVIEAFLYVTLATTFSALGGLVAATLVAVGIFRVWRLHLAFGGVLSGVAAIAAGAGSVTLLNGFVIGIWAGTLTVPATWCLRRFASIDDASLVAAFAAGGAWGTLAIGLFGRHSFFVPQLIGVVGATAIGLLVGAATAGVIRWLAERLRPRGTTSS